MSEAAPPCRIFPDCSCSGQCQQSEMRQEARAEQAAVMAALGEIQEWTPQRRSAVRVALGILERAT